MPQSVLLAAIDPMLIGIVVAGVVVFLIVIMVFASRYTKVGPNEVLIISGRRHAVATTGGMTKVGFRIVRGGGTFVVPVVERVDILSLELMTIDVKTPEVYTVQGVPIMVDGVAQVKVRGDDVSIRTAAEQFLSKSQADIMNVALQTLEGHLRAILGTMTVEEVFKNRETFAGRVQEVAATDMANMGLAIVSFTIRDIRDKQGYLDALGKPRTAQVKRDAVIGQAEADRDATIKSAQAEKEGKTAKFLADTGIASASRDYQMNLADYQASVNQKKAESDLAYDLQKYKTAQLVKREEVQIAVVEKESLIGVQEQEIKRREKELEATIQKPAEAEQRKVRTLAEAEKYRLETEAAGRAAAIRQQGLAEADIVKAKGLAEADASRAKGLAEAAVIQAQGEAMAEAMRKKAEAWEKYGEAAIVQTIAELLPQLAKNVSEPLSRIEKMVVINSGGNGGSGGGGASKITRDVADIVAQLPPIVESLTGVDLAKMIKDFADKQAARAKGPEGGGPSSGT
jgi:flotillin